MCPGVGLLDNMVILLLVFWGTSILFSIVAAPTYISTNSIGGFEMDLFSSGAEWGDEGKGQGPQGRGLFPGTEEGLGDKEVVIPIAGGEGETLISIQSICVHQLCISGHFWLSACGYAWVTVAEGSCLHNNCRNIPSYSLPSPEFCAHQMPNKCFLEPEIWGMKVQPRICTTKALSEPSRVKPLTLGVEK